MNKIYLWCVLLVILATACTVDQVPEAEVTLTRLPSTYETPTIILEQTTNAQTGTPTPKLSPTIVPTASKTPSLTIALSPTSSVAPVPVDLQVAYIFRDSLYLWSNGLARLLVAKPDINSPLLSADGKWIIFRQNLDPLIRKDVVWAIRTDGSGLHQILTPEDLANLSESDLSVLIEDLNWIPDSQTMLFTTTLFNDLVDGDGGEVSDDLYLLDLAGNVTQLAEPGSGGAFTPSPDGRYIAVATRSQIGLWDLEAGTRLTLLDFAPLRLPCDCSYVPQLRWDEQGEFLMTSIPSPHIFYPDDFGNEAEEIWRLSVDGSSEVVAQVEPTMLRNNVVELGPNLERYFYFDGSECLDGDFGTIHIRNLETPTGDRQLPCANKFPHWVPDGEHFIYRSDHWQLGNVDNLTTQQLNFLDLVAKNANWSPKITWIDDTYFLLDLRTDDHWILSLATLDRISAQIFNTSPDAGLQFSFSLAK